MIVFPNAKINLGLNIVSKRTDGYHNLETCFYPIPWTDALEIIESKTTTFTSSGLTIPGDPSTNLCLKAYHSLKEEFTLPDVQIHLHKVIPMGAGLGGGSSDGAFTLKLLNEKFELKLTTDQLERYASKLGSDCPFFIQNRPSIATGRGTELEPCALDLSGTYICLIHPSIHVSTQEAYAGVSPKQPQHSLADILDMRIDHWRGLLVNDFELSVFRKHPKLESLKQSFYDHGAIYAAMSGSGSCLFGIFKEKTAIENGIWFDL